MVFLWSNFSSVVVMKWFLFISFCIFLVPLSAQSNFEKLKELEMTAVNQLRDARKFNTLQLQYEHIKAFEETVREIISYNEAFDFKFDSLGKLISTIKSPDEAFRIFNWNMQYGDYEEQKYYCLIMKKDPKTGNFVTIELWDKSEDMGMQVEFDALTEKKWFGCLYYKIIPLKKGSNTIYTLLGWDGNNMLSNKKVIETMKFYRSDRVKFGEAMFKSEEEKTKRRVIFQYNKQSVMSVKYQETKKEQMIIFDHLSPTSPNLEGMKDWYVTDLSFDAFVLNNGKWVYVKDVDARTGKKFKSKYNAPEDL